MPSSVLVSRSLAGLSAPPLADRRRSGAYPVALLTDHLAHPLAALGLTATGSRFELDAHPIDTHALAALAASVLDDLGARLRRSFRERAQIKSDRLWAEFDASGENLTGLPDDAPAWLTAWLGRNPANPRVREASRVLSLGSIADHDLPERREKADALAATARDLRTSPAAQRLLAASLGPLLPALDPAKSDDLAGTFLATFDELPTLRRADLGRAYATSGSPGALSRSQLYEVASERWGDVSILDGHRLWRPATTTPTTEGN